MSDEVESFWKEAAEDYLKYCPDVCLNRLRKTTEIITEYPAPRSRFEHKPRGLPPDLRLAIRRTCCCSVLP
jgi:hypothetical protein